MSLTSIGGVHDGYENHALDAWAWLVEMDPPGEDPLAWGLPSDGGPAVNKRPLNPITDEHRAAYARDSVVCLRQMFDREWINALQQAAADVVANPADWGHTGPSQDR